MMFCDDEEKCDGKALEGEFESSDRKTRQVDFSGLTEFLSILVDSFSFANFPAFLIRQLF